MFSFLFGNNDTKVVYTRNYYFNPSELEKHKVKNDGKIEVYYSSLLVNTLVFSGRKLFENVYDGSLKYINFWYHGTFRDGLLEGVGSRTRYFNGNKKKDYLEAGTYKGGKLVSGKKKVQGYYHVGNFNAFGQLYGNGKIMDLENNLIEEGNFVNGLNMTKKYAEYVKKRQDEIKKGVHQVIFQMPAGQKIELWVHPQDVELGTIDGFYGILSTDKEMKNIIVQGLCKFFEDGNKNYFLVDGQFRKGKTWYDYFYAEFGIKVYHTSEFYDRKEMINRITFCNSTNSEPFKVD